ncbi:cubilin homolog [Saccostrea cucullata]|uniref:cubilin homolog n=1 Tax=Saccostrea cuccullata TaxID=36930 RepID=UPI002ED656B1
MNINQVVFLFILFYVSPVPACDGVAEIILQPYMGRKVTYPDDYPVNTGLEAARNCSWKIIAAQGYEIVVYPEWVCEAGVTIGLYYGATTSAQKDNCVTCPRTNGYCYDIIQTRASEVLLSMLTISSHSGGGFQFRFMAVERNRDSTCVSGGTRMLAEKTPKFITSPNFPSNYNSNLNCLWTVEPAFIERETRLVFEFRSQYLEMGFDSCSDFVRIDGLNEEFCKQEEDNILQTSSPMPLNSTKANVRFTSDFGYAGSGFVLAFYIETVSGAPQTSKTAHITTHSSSSKTTTGFRQSTSSEITTRSTPENSTSTVGFRSHTSAGIPKASEASPTPETNASHDLSTSTVSPVPACDGVAEIILQPYMGRKVTYPDDYPVNTGLEAARNCSWKIIAAQGYEIVVYPEWVCEADVTIGLYYGATTSAQKDNCVTCPRTNGYCYDIIQTRTSEVLLSMLTISSHSGGGFQFRFMAVKSNRDSTCVSGGTRMLAEKTPKFITSPNFPSNYNSNLNCLWTVEPAFIERETRLVFEFRSQYLEMGFDSCSDFVRIDGLNEEFCKQEEDNILQTSSPMPLNSTKANVRFTSDFGYAGSGFVLAFYIETVSGAPQTSKTAHITTHSSSSKTTTGFRQSTRSEITTRSTPESSTSTADFSQTSAGIPKASDASPTPETNSPQDLSTSTAQPKFLLEMIPPGDFSLKCKEDINLRCTVKHSEFLINLIGESFIWQKNGKKILSGSGYNVTSGKMFTTLRKPSAVLDDSGTYSCSHTASPEPVQVSVYVNVTNSDNTCTDGEKGNLKTRWIKDAISNYLKDKVKLDREIRKKVEEGKLDIEKRKQEMEMEMFKIEKKESNKLLKLLTLLVKDQKDK